MNKNAKRKLTQAQRLETAKEWIAKFEGDDILKAYRKWFVIDRMTALRELTNLGFTFTPERIEKEKRAVQHTKQMEAAKKAKRRAIREAKKNPEPLNPDQDDRFYYIAGYTSGGAPYGVTWEEMGLEPYENPDMKDD